MKFILLGGAILTILTVAEAAIPHFFWFLPIGDSAIAQMGIVLGLAAALSAIVDLWRGKDEKN